MLSRQQSRVDWAYKQSVRTILTKRGWVERSIPSY